MILEGLVTTLNSDGSVNIAPMGPKMDETGSQFELSPYASTTTFANLKRDGVGVLHITDDVLMIARAVVGQLDARLVETQPAIKIKGRVIAEACRWFEFDVQFVDETTPRPVLKCRTLLSGQGREFWGFNRGKHAVLEAAILATRVSFIPAREISQQFERLQIIVTKTGGTDEMQAFAILKAFVESTSNV